MFRAILRIMAALVATLSISAPAYAGPLHVTVTIFPLADVVKRIGGDMVTVSTLLAPGQGPHSFEPTPGVAKTIARSDVVVTAGFGVDRWLEALFASAGSPGTIVIDCSRAVKSDLADGGHSHEHGGVNPHYWLDPVTMIGVVKLLRGALASRLPGEAAAIRKRAAAYIDSIEELDEEIAEKLKHARAGFVGFHNAWPWFVRRYGLNQVGVIEEAPGRAPSAKRIASLIKTIEQTGAKVVMVEPQFSPRLGEALAAEAGVAVVVVDPIGGAPGRESYLELMRFNAQRFYEALK